MDRRRVEQHGTRRVLWVLLVCIGLSFLAIPDSVAQQPPTEEKAFQPGVDAYIYGYPATRYLQTVPYALNSESRNLEGRTTAA